MKHSGRKGIMIITLLVAIVILCLFFIQIEVSPPSTTRVILENTYKTFITPPCFNQAEVTNNLSDSTLARAKELGYEPDSPCTVESLQGARISLFKWIMEKANKGKNQWNW